MKQQIARFFSWVLLTVILVAFAQLVRAQSIKISDMPSATSVGTADVVPIVQSGLNKKAPLSFFVLSNGSYVNPPWIASIDWSKLSGTPSGLSTKDTTFNSTVGMGGAPAGSTIHINDNETNIALWKKLLAPYINPTWGSFIVNSLNSNIPDGTTLGASYTFSVSTMPNSGAYTSATIYDVTNSNASLGSISLTGGNGNGAITTAARKIEVSGTYTSQVWNAKFTDTNKGVTYTSSNITITPHQYVYFGSSATRITFAASSNVTGLVQGSGCSSSTAQPLLWVSTQTDVICSGTNQYLYIAIPSTRTFSGTGSNLDALGANVSFTQVATVNVINADGSTTRSYKVYEHDHGAAFVTANRIQISIN